MLTKITNLTNPTKEYIMAILTDFTPIVDLTNQLADIQYTLDKGITVKLIVDGGRVYFQYDVRVMRRGKRATLGPFFTADGAIDALYSFKRSGIATISKKEIEAKSAVAVARIDTLVALETSTEILPMIKLEELFAFNNILPYHITAEKVLSLPDERGEVWAVTPAMQSAYNNWQHEQYLANQDKEETMQEGITSDLASKLPIKEQAMSDVMSDDEYNKMMGLDDEET
jgi:uncharacterized protein YciI